MLRCQLVQKKFQFTPSTGPPNVTRVRGGWSRIFCRLLIWTHILERYSELVRYKVCEFSMRTFEFWGWGGIFWNSLETSDLNSARIFPPLESKLLMEDIETSDLTNRECDQYDHCKCIKRQQTAYQWGILIFQILKCKRISHYNIL